MGTAGEELKAQQELVEKVLKIEENVMIENNHTALKKYDGKTMTIIYLYNSK